MKRFSPAADSAPFCNCCNSSLRAKRSWRPASSSMAIIPPPASGLASMAVSPARIAAFNILLRVERESAYAVELLHSALLGELSHVDRHLVTEIVMGVLRWRSVLDQTIAMLSFTPFRKLDLEVLTALRMGVYQKQFLSKIPAHAAVNETVELVKQAKKVSAAGLVNAVMRKVKSAAYDSHAARLSGVDYLSSSLAHPRWLAERWISSFGDDVARK